MTLDDWRGATLSRFRKWIEQADPGVVEERKWIKPTNPDGVPVWSHDGMICTGEIYKDHVKVTFAKGASLKDPSPLFNAILEGNLRRGIDVQEGETIDERAFKALIREAVVLNEASIRRKKSPLDELVRGLAGACPSDSSVTWAACQPPIACDASAPLGSLVESWLGRCS